MDSLQKLRIRYNFLLLAVASAILAVVAGLYGHAVAVGLGGGLALADLLPHLLADGVIIFLAAELVERTLLANFDREADKRVVELGDRLTTEVDLVLRSSLDDARYAAHYNVHLRPPRRSLRNQEISYGEIANAIAEAEWIQLLCTSGRDIFSNDQIVTNALLTRARANPINITVLSCLPADLGGTYALVRGELEEPEYPNIVSRDAHVALEDFKKLYLLAKHSNSLFRWCYYDFVPQSWVLLTDKVGFAEIYHFSNSIRNRGMPSFCMGGKVPLFSFSPMSGLYDSLHEYLSYLSGDALADNDTAQRHRRDFFKVTEAYNSSVPNPHHNGRHHA